MVKITIRVELSANNFYSLHNVKVSQVPRVGELVDLASLMGLDVRGMAGYAQVESVLHPFSKRWRTNNPVIVFEASQIHVEALEKTSTRWYHYEATSCRRN